MLLPCVIKLSRAVGEADWKAFVALAVLLEGGKAEVLRNQIDFYTPNAIKYSRLLLKTNVLFLRMILLRTPQNTQRLIFTEECCLTKPNATIWFSAQEVIPLVPEFSFFFPASYMCKNQKPLL